jgi:hypothetical protein
MSDRHQNSDPRGRPECPRSEPEIIPPDRPRGRGRIWVSADEHTGSHRVYVAQPGPFTIILALAVLGLIALVMLIVLLSVALIWIPLVVVLVAAFVLTMYWRRFRLWLARR